MFAGSTAATQIQQRCTCANCVKNTHIPRNTTAAEQEEAIAQLKSELTVDEAHTSQHRRKYESATDSRPSSQTIGYLGVIFLTAALGLIVAIDISSLCCRAHDQKVNGRKEAWETGSVK